MTYTAQFNAAILSMQATRQETILQKKFKEAVCAEFDIDSGGKSFCFIKILYPCERDSYFFRQLEEHEHNLIFYFDGPFNFFTVDDVKLLKLQNCKLIRTETDYCHSSFQFSFKQDGPLMFL